MDRVNFFLFIKFEPGEFNDAHGEIINELLFFFFFAN